MATRGRPKKADSDRLTRQIQIRLTAAEAQALAWAALCAGLSVSELIRRAVVPRETTISG